MKLISCNVIGFGALNNYKLSFNENLTELSRDNGSGKTTVATFIKSMLYGMAAQRKNSRDFGDREHFFPFDGEKCGGVLLLEAEGKEYRIERYFDKKSEKKDTLTVYEDGVKIEMPDGRDVGEALLGVNKETFERTLFTTADDICVPPNSDIKTKLGGVVQGDDDSDGFDNAIELLDDAIKSFKLTRKTKSSTALIVTANENIKSLNEKIINTEKLETALDGKYAEEERLKTKEQEIRVQLDAVNTRETKKAQRDAYDRLCSEIEEAEKKRDELENKYPNGLPTDDDINELRRLQKERSSTVSKNEVEHFTLAEKDKLQALKSKFSVGLPTEEQLESLNGSIAQYNDASRDKAALAKYTDTDTATALRKRFANSRPSEEELKKAKDQLNEYVEAKRKYDEAPSFLISATQGVKAPEISSAPYVIFAVVSALISVIGVVLLATGNSGIGAALAAIGAVILVFSGFLYLNKKTSASQSLAPQTMENAEKTKLKEQLEVKKNALLSLLLPYGYNSELGLQADMKSLCDDLADYERLIRQDEERAESIEKLNESINALEQDIKSFFGKYDLSGDDFENLSLTLKLDIQAFGDLSKRETEAATARAEAENQIADIDQKLEQIKAKYALSEISPERIEQDKKDIAKYNNEISEKSKKAKNYRNEHGISDTPDTSLDDLDPEKLNDELNDYQSALAAVRKKIEEDETETEKLDGYRSELADAENRLTEYETKHRLLTKTKELLTDASKSLNNKYVKPVLDEFLANTAKLDNALGREMTVNKEFEISFEHNGELQSEKFLSAGQRTLCALCFRIAIIKNMYGSAIPFMILDDPFLTLDEGNMEKAKLILKELAEDTQILYFTCHPSRNIHVK